MSHFKLISLSLGGLSLALPAASLADSHFRIHCPPYHHELVLTQRLAELTIELNSDDLSKFVLNLRHSCDPLQHDGAHWCEAARKMELKASDQKHGLKFDLTLDFNSSFGELREESATQSYQVAPKACRILTVD